MVEKSAVRRLIQFANAREAFYCLHTGNKCNSEHATQFRKSYVNIHETTPGKLEKYAWPRWESNLRPLEYQPNAPPTEPRGQVGSSMRHLGTESSSFDIIVI